MLKIKNFTSLVNHAINENSKLNIDDYYEKIVILIEGHKRLKKKTFFFDFVNTNTEFLEELIRLDVLKYIFKFGSHNNTTTAFCKLLEHIIQNYDNKQLILQNMSELEKLLIESVYYEYEPNAFELEEKTGIEVYEHGAKETEGYTVSSFFTDGKVNWTKDDGILEYEIKDFHFQKNSKHAYRTYVSDCSYILSYTKSSECTSGILMIINRLDFDTKSLPSFEDLYSSTKWQVLGNEETKAIDDIGLLLSNCNILKTNMDDIKNMLSQLSNTEEYKQALLLSKKLCNVMENLSIIMLNNYKKEGLIAEEDFQKNFQK